MTPQEIAMQKAEELYAHDHRWRMIIDSTTYAALEGAKATHSPHALAREASMLMLGRIFAESGELETLQQQLDHTKQQMLKMAHLTPPAPMVIINKPALSALRTAEAWLSRWAEHVGNCPGYQSCTCGLAAATHETALVIQAHDHPEQEKQP